MLGIIIQARTGSTRLPNKVILPFNGSESILEIIIHNIKSNFDLPIILATTINTSDEQLVDLANKNKISFFRGSEQNVLSRFIDISTNFGFKYIIRVCADNPFLSVKHLSKLINEFEKSSKIDYLGFQLSNNIPAIKSHLGIFAELICVEALIKVTTLTKESKYYEHVTNYIYENPRLFNVKFINADPFIFNRHDIRLTIDTKFDFHLLRDVFKQTNAQKIEDVILYLDNHPTLIKNMKQQIKTINK